MGHIILDPLKLKEHKNITISKETVRQTMIQEDLLEPPQEQSKTSQAKNQISHAGPFDTIGWIAT